LAILSLTIVATLSSVGLILSIGLLSSPGAIAFLVARSFGRMLITSVAVCLFAMLAGTYLSFFINSATGPTIILVLTALFIAAFVRRLAITRATSRRLGAPG
jgi:manganese/iron transport system permease protein